MSSVPRLPNPFRTEPERAFDGDDFNVRDGEKTRLMSTDHERPSFHLTEKPRMGHINNSNITQQDLLSMLQKLEADIELIKDRVVIDPVPIHPPKRNPFLKPWITNNLLLLTFVWQILDVLVLTLIAHKSELAVDVSIGLMIFFQCLNLILIVLVSIKLVKQLLHRNASGLFLVQSYLSTIMLFAGIYMLLFRINMKTFSGLPESADRVISMEMFDIWVRFLYFSVTTMSTVGYGDIYPTMWYSCLVAMLQMLLNTLYTVVIFAKGMAHFAQQQPAGPVPKLRHVDLQ